MKGWSTLKNAINAVIKTNGNQEITGAVLNSVLNSIVSSLGQNRTFVGVAVPSTNPGAPDGPVFYLAFTKGTYANFAGAKVENNAIILQNTNTTWQAIDTGLKIDSTQDTSYIESCISSLLTDATKVPIVQLQGIILPEDEANDYFNVQDLVGIVYHASRNLITNFANGEFIDNIDQSGYYQGSGAIGMPLSNTIYFVPQITGYAHPGLYWYNGTQLSNITQNLIDHVDGLIEDVNTLQSSVDDLSKPPHNITLTHSSDNNLTTWSGADIGDIHQGDILTWSDTDETYKAVVISENTVGDLRVIQARFTPSGDEGSSINALYLYSNGSATITVFDIIDGTVKKVTHSQLKSLRDNGKLIPGMKYRITDYSCETTQQGTTSAHNNFDIIVTALSSNVLSEEASAIRHEGDTYFANSRLEAWKVWYKLDGCNKLFKWSLSDDNELFRGTIYRLIDEFGNDCPYDFKSIQFIRHEIGETLFGIDSSKVYNVLSNNEEYGDIIHHLACADNTDPTTNFNNLRYRYTFDGNGVNEIMGLDRSVNTNVEISEGEIDIYDQDFIPRNNIIKPVYETVLYDEQTNYSRVQVLNDIVFMQLDTDTGAYAELYDVKNNSFINCHSITLPCKCAGNTFNKCYNIVMGVKSDYNSLHDCYDAIIGCRSANNIIRDSYNFISGAFYNNTVVNFSDCDWSNSSCVGCHISYVHTTACLTNFNNSVITNVTNSRIIPKETGADEYNGSMNVFNIDGLTFQLRGSSRKYASIKSDGTLRLWNPADN